MNYILQKTKITSLKKELVEKDRMIAARTNEIDILKSEVEDKKGQITALNQEIENRDKLNEHHHRE